ncbi:MAG: hypothetical protein JWO38_7739 [Gemmataceae bacterium]|nr:hypothetical protein [Gemmataceae bacterium]
MPRQNRVTPFGELVAVAARGTLMGNRGCLHDAPGTIRRAFQVKRWIVCVLEFKGRHRQIMRPGSYTELFFLDEATALAAGHRPCSECQRARYTLFRDVWTTANPDRTAGAPPTAGELDAVLHAERLRPDRGKRTYTARPADLPRGAMAVGEGGVPHVVLGDTWAPWTAAGYRRAVALPAGVEVEVLTPPSVVRAIAAGFPVGIHESSGP